MQDILKCFVPPIALLAAFLPSGGAARADELAKADITIVVPPDAEVFFDGAATMQKGADRLFTTPPLPVGRKFYYDVLARWKGGDKTVEQTAASR